MGISQQCASKRVNRYRQYGFTASLREARHYRIKSYTPKHKGTVERYNRILAEKLLHSRE